jgi:RNA polymerase sigma-54 factor
VAPDVSIVRAEEGYQIILNDEGIPRLGLNSAYRRLLQHKESLSKEEKVFLREKLRLAIELIKSLDHRNRTIYKVSESILKFQRDFFDRGRDYLKPLNLKDVAQDIGMHESTISRVTSNKFLSCEHGVVGFRFFFSSALQSGSGKDISSTSVKDMIKRIIAAEDSSKPLSDQMIADKFILDNIKIARRTVAKYREELRIPPQNMRKR